MTQPTASTPLDIRAKWSEHSANANVLIVNTLGVLSADYGVPFTGLTLADGTATISGSDQGLQFRLEYNHYIGSLGIRVTTIGSSSPHIWVPCSINRWAFAQKLLHADLVSSPLEAQIIRDALSTGVFQPHDVARMKERLAHIAAAQEVR